MNKLILMCGVAGSGKTVYSKDYIKLFPHIIRLSTDECRAIAGVNEGDQTVSYKVFESLYLITEHLLHQGETILIDATNYNKKNRKRFLDIAKTNNVEIEAIVVNNHLTFSKLMERNNKRDRKVPTEVLDKQFNGFEEPTTEEGFNLIKYVNNP